MPLYEYQCPNDGRFEVIRKFSDPPLTACPTCGAEVHKLLSAPAIQFKGTGWYITDYARKGGSGGESKSGGKDGGKDGGKEGGKGDSGAGEAGKSASAGGESAKSDSASSTAAPSSSGTSGSGKT